VAEVAIEPVGAEAALTSLLPQIPAVWVGVADDRLHEILPRHASRDGFRFMTARAAGRLVGIAYGYVGAAGQWWHDIVSAAMTDHQRRRWLGPGHFELVELHVHPDYRRQGVGGRLHDALLAETEAPTAVLSTEPENEPALALYRQRGWEIVIPELYLEPAGAAYAILGLDLQSSGFAKRRPVSSKPRAR